jgi:hypothetical protein
MRKIKKKFLLINKNRKPIIQPLTNKKKIVSQKKKKIDNLKNTNKK